MAVYNVEKYIAQCIESIINQSFNNLEIILVNDGSTDASGEICESYAEYDSRIKVIHQKNGGLSAARNTGILNSQSDYITFIDGDDYIHRQYVEHLFRALQQECADIACAGYWTVSDSGKKQKEHYSSKRVILLGREQLRALLCDNLVSVTTWGKIYKKTLFEKIKFPQGKLHEDVFTTHLLLAKSNKCVVINEALYYYRQRNNSIVTQSFKLEHLDSVVGAKERADFIADYSPDLIQSANAKVAWAASSVFQKMCNSNTWDTNVVQYLHNIAKETWYPFCKDAHVKLSSKLFLTLLVVSPLLAKYVSSLNRS